MRQIRVKRNILVSLATSRISAATKNGPLITIDTVALTVITDMILVSIIEFRSHFFHHNIFPVHEATARISRESRLHQSRCTPTREGNDHRERFAREIHRLIENSSLEVTLARRVWHNKETSVERHSAIFHGRFANRGELVASSRARALNYLDYFYAKHSTSILNFITKATMYYDIQR